jgi:hypothetical protein
MDKHKLVRIILKDLEEIKNLSEEVAECQDNTALIIDLALNRSRLLCQEIELLREFYGKTNSIPLENDESSIEEEEEEALEAGLSDPEFEIINFDQKEIPQEEQLAEDEIQEDESVLEIPIDEEPEEEYLIEEEEDDDLEEEEEEESLKEMDEVEPILDEIEEPGQKQNEPVNEFKEAPKQGFRTIPVEELEDNDDLDQMRFMPSVESSTRPVMHEIPKPEKQVQEKPLLGDSFQNEQSVNDVIGEKKAEESNLINSPISSLRASIGLNDRFLFIREIFANNTDKYNTVIDQLDKLETIQQAVEFLKANITLQKNETSLKFVELLKRRFSK